MAEPAAFPQVYVDQPRLYMYGGTGWFEHFDVHLPDA